VCLNFAVWLWRGSFQHHQIATDSPTTDVLACFFCQCSYLAILRGRLDYHHAPPPPFLPTAAFSLLTTHHPSRPPKAVSADLFEHAPLSHCYLCSIERSNTLARRSPINIRRTAISRGHTVDCQAEQQPSLAPAKSSALRFRPGEEKFHPGPIISEQSPVLTQHRKRNTEKPRR
jgi:hypothetical protein